MFPQADVPVVPIAWPADWDAAAMQRFGQRLGAAWPAAATAAELAPTATVVLLASGSITHNLRRVFADPAHGLHPPLDAGPTVESSAFRDWWADAAVRGQHNELVRWAHLAPHGALMHPSDEHLVPYFAAAGAARAQKDDARAWRLHEGVTYGDLGMDAYAFGAAGRRLAALLADGPGVPAGEAPTTVA
jgi:4,5-DOPA dioxygenase extradiol